MRAVREVFESGYLGMGDIVSEFERMLGEYFGSGVVCVSTGTAALHLACEALPLTAGDEVLVQSLTYAATYQAIAACRAIPVSCDVYGHDLSIDLGDAESKITKKTKAIVPVHYSGFAGNLHAVRRFAQAHNLRVIEDAAHAFGSQCGGSRVGASGDIACFSFDPVKNLTCGEGGAVVTRDESVIEHCKRSRILGIQREKSADLAPRDMVVESVRTGGWRYHMSNINAAIGIAQLNKFEELKRKRQDLARRYVDNLRGTGGIDLLPYDFNEVVPYIFVVKLLRKTNHEVIAALREYGVHAGFHYYPCHLQPYFSALFECRLPVTEAVFLKLLSLPLHPGMQLEDVDRVSAALSEVLRR